MNIFLYDKTFEGLLTSVFEAYSRRTFPDALLLEGEPLPLFCDEIFTVITDEEKSGRVWRGLQKKLSSAALACLARGQMVHWLAENQIKDPEDLQAFDQLGYQFCRSTSVGNHTAYLWIQSRKD